MIHSTRNHSNASYSLSRFAHNRNCIEIDSERIDNAKAAKTMAKKEKPMGNGAVTTAEANTTVALCTPKVVTHAVSKVPVGKTTTIAI